MNVFSKIKRRSTQPPSNTKVKSLNRFEELDQRFKETDNKQQNSEKVAGIPVIVALTTI